MQKEQEAKNAELYEESMKEVIRASERSAAARPNRMAGNPHHQADTTTHFESGDYFKQIDMTKKAVEEKIKKAKNAC